MKPQNGELKCGLLYFCISTTNIELLPVASAEQSTLTVSRSDKTWVWTVADADCSRGWHQKTLSVLSSAATMAAIQRRNASTHTSTQNPRDRTDQNYRTNKSVFSLVPRLSTWHCPHLLLSAVLRHRSCWVPAPASIYTVRQKKGTNFLCESFLTFDRNWRFFSHVLRNV